jgi:hypothetical protein
MGSTRPSHHIEVITLLEGLLIYGVKIHKITGRHCNVRTELQKAGQNVPATMKELTFSNEVKC